MSESTRAPSSLSLFGLGVAAIAMLLALGGLTGWLVGASREPAVTAFLPILLGIIGTIGLARVQNAITPRASSSDNEPEGAAPVRPGKPRRTADPKSLVRFTTILCWGFAAFCAAVFLGVKIGVRARVGDRGRLPTVSELMENKVDVSDPEYIELLRLRMALTATDATEAEVREVFRRMARPGLDRIGQVVGELAESYRTRLYGVVHVERADFPALRELIDDTDLQDREVAEALESLRGALGEAQATPEKAREILASTLQAAREARATRLRYIQRARIAIEDALLRVPLSADARPGGVPCVPSTTLPGSR